VFRLTFDIYVVMVGLVPTIHLSASSSARGTLDPRDKPEDDTGIFYGCQNTRMRGVAERIAGLDAD
jgi:hypothetical protein